MGKHVIRQTPRTMPSAARAAQAMAGLEPAAVVVAGSRATTAAQNREPGVQHTEYRLATGTVEALAGRHVVIFAHGYNVTTDDAMTHSGQFFQRLRTALERDRRSLERYGFVAFTWPGDTGTVYFDAAQDFAQHSGVALFNLLAALQGHQPASVTLFSHSLGAHVLLRALAILGQRGWTKRITLRADSCILLGAAVEDDVFERPHRGEEYHFPESAFGMRSLHIVASRDDEVLTGAFRINEADRALGATGPERMDALVSLRARVRELLGPEPEHDFRFELHDFSRRSATIFDPALRVSNHGDYASRPSQFNYYVNFVPRDPPTE
jgi:esterase/lipase superfamily enzyme